MLSEDQQERILAYILRLQPNTSALLVVIQESFFSDGGYKAVFRALKDLYDRHKLKKTPTPRELLPYVRARYDPTSDLVRDHWDSRIPKLYDVETTEVTWLEICDVIVRQGVADLSGVAGSKAGSKVMLESLRAQVTTLTPLVEPVRENNLHPVAAVDFIRNRIQELSSPESRPRILFGWSNLDNYTGGLFRGELAMLFAPTGAGKTFTAVNIMVNMVEKGSRVMYVNLDNSPEVLLARIYARMCQGVHEVSALEKAEGLQAAAPEISEWLGGTDRGERMFVMNLPPNEVTVSALKAAVLAADRRMPAPFEVLIVDYDSKLLPDRLSNEHRHNESGIVDGLLNIAVETEKVVVVLDQSNRDGVGMEVVTLKNLSESYAKARPCSLVLSVCQTEGESKMDPPQGRLMVLKNRSGKSGQACHMIMELSRGMVRVNENVPAWAPGAVDETVVKIPEGRYSLTKNGKRNGKKYPGPKVVWE